MNMVVTFSRHPSTGALERDRDVTRSRLEPTFRAFTHAEHERDHHSSRRSVAGERSATSIAARGIRALALRSTNAGGADLDC
jgi:hypothetical protein